MKKRKTFKALSLIISGVCLPFAFYAIGHIFGYLILYLNGERIAVAMMGMGVSMFIGYVIWLLHIAVE